jgi:predicted Zn-dependent protease
MNDKKPPPPLSPYHKKVLSKFQTVPVAPLTKARRLFHTGHIQAAEDVVLAILAASPDNGDCLHLHGLIALQQGDPRQAANRFARAIEAGHANDPVFHASHERALKLVDELGLKVTGFNGQGDR